MNVINKQKLDDQIKGKGLLPLSKDKRDYSHHRTFGAVSLAVLPKKFIIEPLNVDDQLLSYLCTAYSSSSVGEDQWGQAFSPEFQAAKIGQLLGRNIARVGAELRDAMKAGVRAGFLPLFKAPFTLKEKGEQFIGDWNNWPKELDGEAARYKMSGYYNALD